MNRNRLELLQNTALSVDVSITVYQVTEVDWNVAVKGKIYTRFNNALQAVTTAMLIKK